MTQSLQAFSNRIAATPSLTHPDGDKVADWAAENGYTYQLIGHPLKPGEFWFRAAGTFGGRPFSYMGSRGQHVSA